MGCLQGLTAVITGSSKGIGRGIAEAYAKEGADVVIVSRNQGDCQKVAQELAEKYKVKTLAQAADITKMEQIENLAGRAMAAMGRIDIIVNNAGNAVTKSSEDLTEEDWDSVLNLDLKSVFFCSQILSRDMRQRGRGKIINIASNLALIADKRVLAYCVAKGGVLQLTRVLGLEWAKYTIQVNALCPGYILTDINAQVLNDPHVGPKLLARIPMGRVGKMEEVTGAAVFLASGASDYMTGQYMIIDGGRLTN